MTSSNVDFHTDTSPVSSISLTATSTVDVTAGHAQVFLYGGTWRWVVGGSNGYPNTQMHTFLTLVWEGEGGISVH